VSRYSDKKKRQSGATCAASASCPFLGSILRVVDSRPDWYCKQHTDQIDAQRKQPR
jgi:hypothetical protein